MVKVFSSVFFVLALGSFAHAHEEASAPAAAAGGGACAADVAQLCSGVEHGDGRIAKCLRDNKDKVSAECKANHEKMKAAFKEVKEACHDDVEKFCSSVKGGKGRIMKCMKEHKEELSAGCKAEIAEMKEHRKNRRGK